jgi:hypothetical protein
MALRADDLMLRLAPSPAHKPLEFGGGGANTSMERERLKLMREEFEERKRQNAETNRLREMETNALLTRERLEAERKKQEQEAAAAAERQKLADAAYGDVYKSVDGNDFAGIDAAAQRLREFGGYAENLGTDPQGRPSWRLGRDAAAEQKRQAQLQQQAQPGQLQPQSQTEIPADTGAVVSEERMSSGPAMDESLLSSLNRLSALGYDETQRGVLDMGAMADQRRAQTQPALDAIASAYPDNGRRESTRRVGEGVASLGLSPIAAIDKFNTLNAQPGSAVQSALDAQADLDKEQAKADAPMRPKEEQELVNYGYDRSDKSFKTQKAGDRIVSLEMADELTRLITSPNPSDHGKAVNLMMVLGKQSGPQSDADAQRIAGNEDLSTLEKAQAWLRKLVVGGKWESVQKSMVEFAKRARERERAVVFSWMDSQNAAIENAKHPLTAEGHKQFMRELPAFVLEEYKKEREAEDGDEPSDAPTGGAQAVPVASPIDIEPEEPAPGEPAEAAPGDEPELDDDVRDSLKEPPAAAGGKPSRVPLEEDADFMEALEAHAAEAGLNVEDILPLIGFESGGDPQARNPKSGASGLIQFTNTVARGYGFKDAAEFGRLSATEQVPFVIDYLKTRGIKPEHDQGDMYVAIAAPGALDKPDDHAVYTKGTDEYDFNPAWDLDGDGKVTRGELHRLGASKGRSRKKGASKPGPKDAELDALLE